MERQPQASSDNRHENVEASEGYWNEEYLILRIAPDVNYVTMKKIET